MPKETIGKTFFVAAALCVICSVLVSTAAVTLRPTQGVNKLLDKKRNILTAAGLFDESRPIDELFENIDEKVVDLASGEYVDIDPDEYDQRNAARDPDQSVAIPAKRDPAGIKRRAKFAAVYLVYRKGEVDKVILPVHGKGLWSTLYGFLAIDIEDVNTIRSLVYYEHGETPGPRGRGRQPPLEGAVERQTRLRRRGQGRNRGGPRGGRRQQSESGLPGRRAFRRDDNLARSEQHP